MSLMSRDQVSHQAAAGSDRPSAVCPSEALREPIFALMRGWALTLKYGRLSPDL
jgi:hypothetical protein